MLNYKWKTKLEKNKTFLKWLKKKEYGLKRKKQKGITCTF